VPVRGSHWPPPFPFQGRVPRALTRRFAPSSTGIRRLAAIRGGHFPVVVFGKETGGMTARRLVVPATKGGWNVLKPGSKRASSRHPTMAEAARRAWEIVDHAGGGEVVLMRSAAPGDPEGWIDPALPARNGQGRSPRPGS